MGSPRGQPNTRIHSAKHIATTCLLILAALFTSTFTPGASAQQVDYLPAWALPNGTAFNAPHFQPASGNGVACFALQNFDQSTQVAACQFFSNNNLVGETTAAQFSFLDLVSRYPEVLPFAGDTNNALAQSFLQGPDFFSCSVPPQPSGGPSSLTMKISIKMANNPTQEIASLPRNQTIQIVATYVPQVPTIQSVQQSGSFAVLTLTGLSMADFADPTQCSYEGRMANISSDCFVCIWTPQAGGAEIRTFANILGENSANCSIPPNGGQVSLAFSLNNCPVPTAPVSSPVAPSPPPVAPTTVIVTITPPPPEATSPVSAPAPSPAPSPALAPAPGNVTQPPSNVTTPAPPPTNITVPQPPTNGTTPQMPPSNVTVPAPANMTTPPAPVAPPSPPSGCTSTSSFGGRFTQTCCSFGFFRYCCETGGANCETTRLFGGLGLPLVSKQLNVSSFASSNETFPANVTVGNATLTNTTTSTPGITLAPGTNVSTVNTTFGMVLIPGTNLNVSLSNITLPSNLTSNVTNTTLPSGAPVTIISAPPSGNLSVNGSESQVPASITPTEPPVGANETAPAAPPTSGTPSSPISPSGPPIASNPTTSTAPASAPTAPAPSPTAPSTAPIATPVAPTPPTSTQSPSPSPSPTAPIPPPAPASVAPAPAVSIPTAPVPPGPTALLPATPPLKRNDYIQYRKL